MDPKTQGRIATFISGCLMGCVSLFTARLSFIPTEAIVSLRGLFGFLILFILISLIRKTTYFKEMIIKFPILIIVIGITASVTILFYFKSINLTNPGSAAFLLYTGPVWAVIFMVIFLKRKPKTRDIYSFIIAIIGIIILTEPWNIDLENTERKDLYIGLLYGISSGLCLGIYHTVKINFFQNWKEKYILQNSKANITNQINLNEKDQGSFGSMTVLTISLACFVCLFTFIIFFFQGIPYYKELDTSDWFVALALGIFPTALAFSLINIGLKEDYGGNVLIFSYSEPVIGAIIAAFRDSILSWTLFLGGFLIILANMLIIHQDIKEARKKIPVV